MLLKKTLLFISVVLSVAVFAQGTYMPLDYDMYHYIDRIDIKYGRVTPMPHTANKPYLRGEIGEMAVDLKTSNIKLEKRQAAQLTYLMDDNAEWIDTFTSRTKHPIWLFRRGSKAALYREPANLIAVNVKDFSLKINPVFAFRVGAETHSGGLRLINSRGVDLRFTIKKFVSGYFYISENQTRLSDYVQSKYMRDSLDKYEYVPGNGYWKEYNSSIFKIKNGVDYFDVRGYITINALKYFNITFGHDKQFIGNGYRSMFLSDNAAPALFLKLNTHIWRINYQNIFMELVNQYERGGDQLLAKKYGAFHHLDIDIAHFLNIGFFEGVILNRKKQFDIQYLNPIIFYRSIEQSIGSPDNALLGIDFKSNFANHVSLYGQFLLDEFNFKNLTSNKKWWGNKYALQIGAKYIDIIPQLDAQVEFNMARPFMYGHNQSTYGNGNYSHYNQPLAHPLGANFWELVTILQYQPIKNFNIQLKYIHAVYGEDTLLHDAAGTVIGVTNYGNDILRNNSGLTTTNADGVISEYGHKQNQGVKSSIGLFNLRASYMFWHNMWADIEVYNRNKNSSYKPYSFNTFIFNIGVRIYMPYKNYDF